MNKCRNQTNEKEQFPARKCSGMENKMEKFLFTSESVTEGHPDKMCDAISDAILDALMEKDPMSRVACEAATCTGFVLVTGDHKCLRRYSENRT